MASYQDKLDARLAQPKMNSPIRLNKNGSQTSLRSLNHSDSLKSAKFGYKGLCDAVASNSSLITASIVKPGNQFNATHSYL